MHYLLPFRASPDALQVIVECQKHSDYQESITWFLDTLMKYGKHGVSGASENHSNARAVFEDETLKTVRDPSRCLSPCADVVLARVSVQAAHELLTLLSRFANNTSTQPTLDAVHALYDDVRRDEALRAWFGQVNAWGRRVRTIFWFRCPASLRRHARFSWNRDMYWRRSAAARVSRCVRMVRVFMVFELRIPRAGIRVGRRFFDDKYKAHFDALFDAVGAWCVAFWRGRSDSDYGVVGSSWRASGPGSRRSQKTR